MTTLLTKITLVIAVLTTPPTMIGLATYYGPPAFREGQIMRDGQPLHLDAATVAVDASHWPAWADATAIVYVPACKRLLRVTVTDTGYLYAAGRFRHGVGPLEVLRWWPDTASGVQWRSAVTHRVVADFPAGFYRCAISCNGETPVVWIWVFPSGKP